ncbi:hypothetical protein RclHR1_07400001 [Rhizophagus clarus]|uniref:Uncharacterized protein n=1 Tax=Rhizophagus clarus TaxID=94130 RepID=A0A2Z6RX34_9GLOM|nr:hypothetical protein RclHR1_07400001 [Rhizophagus clarus]
MAYCSKLLYPSEARWVHYNPTFLYPLEESFSSTLLQFHPNDPIPSRIAVCCSCLNPSTRRHPPKVDLISDEIQNVPIYLQSLFGYSQNINAFALYTGTVGAILSNSERNSWYHLSLLNASKWLHKNNEFFKPYRYYFNRETINGPPLIIPTAIISEFNENLYRNSIIRNIGPPDIVISGNDFDTEIHNEDYRYE